MLCIKCQRPFTTTHPGIVVCKKCRKEQEEENPGHCIVCNAVLTKENSDKKHADGKAICNHCREKYILEKDYLPGSGNVTRTEAKQALQRAEDVKTVFTMLLEGKSIHEIAVATHLSSHKVSVIIYRYAKMPTMWDEGKTEPTDRKKLLPDIGKTYPYNLACAFVDDDKHNAVLSMEEDVLAAKLNILKEAANLSSQEKFILTHTYERYETQMFIAEQLKVSHQRVQQAQKSALIQLHDTQQTMKILTEKAPSGVKKGAGNNAPASRE